MKNLNVAILALLLVVQPLPVLAQSSDAAIIRYSARHHPIVDSEGMVASQNAIASAVGARILADGGNAVDAAVGVGFALAVLLPRAGNIGGGGFMLVHIAEDNETVAIDYREMAPARAHRDMFLDEQGNVDNDLARFSHLSSGVPGTVAGLYAAHERYGSLPWSRLVMPAVELARDGIVISHDLANLLAARLNRLGKNPAARRYFYKRRRRALRSGRTTAPGRPRSQPAADRRAGAGCILQGRNCRADCRGHGSQRRPGRCRIAGGLPTDVSRPGTRHVSRL